MLQRQGNGFSKCRTPIQLKQFRVHSVYLRDDMNFFDIIVSSQNIKCKKEGAV
jgi:hypothetical protein